MRDAIRPRDFWRSLEPKGQLMLVVSALLVVGTLFFLFQYASKPSYVTVAAGIEPADATKAASALDSAGVTYRIESGGTQISVLDGEQDRARTALAGAGLAGSSHVGFELFDKGSLGATDFQQKVDYQRALEGEIARTIEQIDGVGTAQVQLVLPEESLFLDDAPKASAAVLLSGGSGLDLSAIRGIAHLVASSVKGLNSENVTITDDSGSLVWPQGSGSGDGATMKLAAEQQYAANLTAQINAMLLQTLGPNKAIARVHADLSVDQQTVDQVKYAKKGTPLTTTSESEKLKSTGSTNGGPAGTTANVPTYAGGVTGGGTSNYTNKKSSTDFGVDKTVTRTVIAPGKVNRLDVALVVDKDVPADQVKALEDAVRGVAGVLPARGDTFAVSAIDFAKVAEPKAAPSGPAAVLSNPFALLKPIGIGLAAIVFLFLMRKSLKRREGDPIAPEPTWLREIERAIPIGELGPGRLELEARRDPEQERRDQMKAQLEEMVRRQPDVVASQVSSWVRDS